MARFRVGNLGAIYEASFELLPEIHLPATYITQIPIGYIVKELSFVFEERVVLNRCYLTPSDCKKGKLLKVGDEIYQYTLKANPRP